VGGSAARKRITRILRGKRSGAKTHIKRECVILDDVGSLSRRALIMIAVRKF
jgi:hypothetical protein